MTNDREEAHKYQLFFFSKSKLFLHSEFYSFTIQKVSDLSLQVSNFLPSRTTFNLPAPRDINSLIMSLLVNSELPLETLKEFNNEGMKVQVERAFKSFFFVTKKQ